MPEDALDERRAHASAAAMVAAFISDAADAERLERERRDVGVTFRELAATYLARLRDINGAKGASSNQVGGGGGVM